jgi:hypothetical protein
VFDSSVFHFVYFSAPRLAHFVVLRQKVVLKICYLSRCALLV